MVAHLKLRFGGGFGWDGQVEHGSYDTQRKAEYDSKARDQRRRWERETKRQTTEAVLREAFPRQQGG